MLFGGVEAGGTKFVCATGDETGKIQERVEFPTRDPEETVKDVIAFFSQFETKAIGIASFGPIDVNPESNTYGYITTTPKTAWQNYPIKQTIEKALGVPAGFTTDVNGAALGESVLGAAKGLDSCLYITVGTGIGAGAVVKGNLLEGWSHPEMGHILLRRHPDDHFEGACPFHHDCLEGLAAGPAIEARWGQKGKELSDRPEVWEIEADYLAQALMQYILIVSPKKIIMGGGVMHQQQLFPLIHKRLTELINGYIKLPEPLSEYITSPGLGNDAGITGAILLGKQAYETGKL
ncbi:ROK family protein [Heyndrickxia coagulans]|uniref:ROK family protein n=1 Tax=Heyndrickxia coagulans TaxID=1398 RepID=UPI000628947E|nr:ROK family protein [Heyndrickxia coagulans]APB35634.1 fructokinase [Heyndrickxia coagulans]QPG54439.1 ROK family protein [Heyndrickxia coagulans]WNE62511.1 ROK family protein [Heyndrickxia coagulans]